MASALFYLKDTQLTFGGTPLLEGANLTIEPRARIALVGRNGSGKSTLMKIAAGIIEPDHCDQYTEPGVKISYLPQDPDLSGYTTVLDYVAEGLGPFDDDYTAIRLLEEIDLKPDLPTNTLSGGEGRRAALARLFAQKPDILLLDEPTNHLDLPAIEWLEANLKNSQTALVVISHDRRFLENVTTRTTWIDRGQTKELNRGFAHFETWRDKLLEEEELEAHKLERKIVREEHWVRFGVTARRKRNVRRMKELSALRKQHREARGPQGNVNFSANETEKSAKRVIEAIQISKSFGDQKIVSDFSIKIGRGARLGFVAPNGAGKTTLLKLLIGELTPDTGTVNLGANLEMVSLDQRRASLTPDMRVADAITDGRGDFVEIDGQKRHAATYLQDFLFTAEQWRAPVSALSGGEKGRLALAAALAKPSNLMVLDEPTNDLDLETLDLLEEMLAGYKGTLLLVSHDRSFLDRIVTSIITQDPAKGPTSTHGHWSEFVGGYDDMLRQLSAISGSTSSTATEKKTSPKKEIPTKPATKPKLSYKDKFALENLPKEIDAFQNTINAAKARLADPKFFDKDSAAFNKTAKELEMAETKLAEAEEQWLILEMKREDLES